MGDTAPSAIRQSVHRPSASSVTAAATLAMPMSIAARGLKRENALPLRVAGAGMLMVVKISPGVRTVRPGPAMHASTGTTRVPVAEAISIVAPSDDQRRHAVGRWRRVADVAANRREVAELDAGDDARGFDERRGSAFARARLARSCETS